MKKRCKTSLCLLALWLLTMVYPVGAAAGLAPGEAAQEGRYVYDQADLLENDQALEEEIQALRSQLQIDIVLVTTDDTEGLTPRQYADDFYDYNNFGYDEPRGDGVLMLIDMDHREVYISTCGKAIWYFTDERIDLALDAIAPKLTDGEYDEACETFLSLTEEFMTHAADEPLSYGFRLKLMLREHWFMTLVIAAVLTAITLGVLAHNKAMDKVSASVYLSPKDGFQIDQKVDQYLNEFTTHRKIPRNEGRSGGGGGGSSTHSSSSGTSHGGGGRSF